MISTHEHTRFWLAWTHFVVLVHIFLLISVSLIGVKLSMYDLNYLEPNNTHPTGNNDRDVVAPLAKALPHEIGFFSGVRRS